MVCSNVCCQKDRYGMNVCMFVCCWHCIYEIWVDSLTALTSAHNIDGAAGVWTQTHDRHNAARTMIYACDMLFVCVVVRQTTEWNGMIPNHILPLSMLALCLCRYVPEAGKHIIRPNPLWMRVSGQKKIMRLMLYCGCVWADRFWIACSGHSMGRVFLVFVVFAVGPCVWTLRTLKARASALDVMAV